MQFTKLGDLEVVTRVTGPHHHFLGLQLTQGLGTTAVLERVSRDGKKIELSPYGQDEICFLEVQSGISEANERLGTNYSVSRIRFCEGDQSTEGVYRQLAGALVEHVAERDRRRSEPRGRTARVDDDAVYASGQVSGEVTTESRSPTRESGQFITTDS